MSDLQNSIGEEEILETTAGDSSQLDQLLSELGLDLVGGSSSGKEGWTYYRLLSVNNVKVKNHSGKWGGKMPLQAGKKGFTRILQDNKAQTKDNYKVKFQIIEVKQGGDKKVFSYEGVNKKRNKPVSFTIKGKKYTSTHEGIVHKLK